MGARVRSVLPAALVARDRPRRGRGGRRVDERPEDAAWRHRPGRLHTHRTHAAATHRMAAGARGVPVRACFLVCGDRRGPRSRRRERDARRPDHERAAARPLPARRLARPARRAAAPRRGPERDRGGRRVRAPWWGWGDPPPFPEVLRSLIPGGLPERRTPHVSLAEVRLPESRLPDALRDAATTDRDERVLHAAGKSYPDLVRIRSGDASRAPDGVLYPESHDEGMRLLELCASEGVAVVPFGGGTSVVGGVEALRGPFSSVVALDLARIDHLTTDRVSLLGTFGAGLRGPQAETRLAGRGLTLGHFPQSFEFATIGGYAATRSAGQASTGYGRFDKLVVGLRCATPSGEIVVKPVPGTAAA